MTGGIALGYSQAGVDFPTLKNYSWPDDRTLDAIFSLEPSHQYGFSVLGSNFVTKDGHNAGDTKEFNFTTGK